MRDYWYAVGYVYSDGSISDITTRLFEADDLDDILRLPRVQQRTTDLNAVVITAEAMTEEEAVKAVSAAMDKIASDWAR